MILYRYKRNIYSILTGSDEDGFFDFDRKPKVDLIEYNVVRETEKSYFIFYMKKEKIVSKNAKNTFAYNTKEKALYNYKRRCLSNLGHCTRNYELAKIFHTNSKTITIHEIS